MITIAPKITDEGINLALRNLGGESITFTRFKIGNGEAVENSSALTDLVNPVMELAISEFDATSIIGAVKLTCALDFSAIEQDFKWSEIGIFCNDAGGNEILFAYSNDVENAGSLKSDMDGVVGSIGLAFIITMSSTENVQAIVSGLLLYATKEELNDHVERRDNPHEVTREQVGLGNVPNVATNDQTPTFNVSNTLENLKSGETLSVLLGKVAKAVKEFILHLQGKNPHSLTAEDIEAADKEHTHNTADIVNGVLPYARGGTNVATLKDLRSSIILTMIYEGDNSEFREINIGARPRAVFITDCFGRTSFVETNGYCYAYGGLAVDGSNSWTYHYEGAFYGGAGWGMNTAVRITNNGFAVRYGKVSKNTSNIGDGIDDQVRTNMFGLTYHALIVL